LTLHTVLSVPRKSTLSQL